DWDPARSVPRGALRPLARLPGLRWFSLQYPQRPTPFSMFDLACRDLREFAVRMRHLDLIVSVDTLTAHLAGALGLPIWLLLPESCDWRWMQGRSDSPWYPTMRLFRQRREGEWDGVIAELAAALRGLSPPHAGNGARIGPTPASRSAMASARAPGPGA
ncbi:MAG TPA: hypothetical protein VJ722_00540, partial [Rhodanobacteraceae bacterium]|nr:hypothetical protein [Rhodanobacteraceae bacterium]